MHFNSHAHVERDSLRISASSSMWSFQLTRSRGAWHIPRYVDTFEKDFNSHAHVERDLETKYGVFQPKDISTHTLTWSVTRYHVVWPDEEFEFQLTRSRGAWRHDVLLAVLFKISTHTLTWSVTSCFACSLTVPSISTHTLTWSVTLRVFISLSCFANFNSHAHVERDAPHRLSERKRLNFNSHAHVERDVLRNSWQQGAFHFNSHAHVERDWTHTAFSA